MISASEYFEKIALSSGDVVATGLPAIVTGNPVAGYSGYKGKRDKEKGVNNMRSHIALGALSYPALVLLGSRGLAASRPGTLVGAGGVGAAVHAGSYGLGRLMAERKKNKKG
jgi:hypothetical protein